MKVKKNHTQKDIDRAGIEAVRILTSIMRFFEWKQKQPKN